jgi:cyclopropane-fatty-acyl-phospholipid synthase
MTTHVEPKPVSAFSGASGRSIRAHYDRPQEFFRLFLGETMCYSAGLFQGGRSLDDAQTAKMDFHLDAASVRQGCRLLDVGCGWGGVLRRAVEIRSAAHAVGITLSASQAAFVRQLAAPRIEVFEQHWRDHQPSEPYDAIVSIGALEHFADAGCSESERQAIYGDFFAMTRSWLKSGGALSIQCIVHGSDSSKPNVFSENGTFQESALPHLWELVRASRNELELVQITNGREDYVATLDWWIRRLKENQDRASELIGPDQVANFLRYLRVARAGFALGTTGLARMSFVPLSRKRG